MFGLLKCVHVYMCVCVCGVFKAVGSSPCNVIINEIRITGSRLPKETVLITHLNLRSFIACADNFRPWTYDNRIIFEFYSLVSEKEGRMEGWWCGGMLLRCIDSYYLSVRRGKITLLLDILVERNWILSHIFFLSGGVVNIIATTTAFGGGDL